MISRHDPVRDHMVRNPITIDADLTLADAKARMAGDGIRHLPVFDDERLVGILTARDILLMESFLDVEAKGTSVRAAMTGSLKTCEPSDSLGHALLMMVEYGVGAIPVLDGGVLVGIFSTVDAAKTLLRVLAKEEGSRK